MVLSHIDDAHLRYGLRVYFIGGMFLLTIIGSQCCKLATKYDLLRGKTVHLHRMTGWLYPKELFYCIWKLRRFPGGWWLGFMMIVAAVVTIAADFATNSVKAVPTHARCKFDMGLVSTLNISDVNFDSPPAGGYASTLASNAQSTSIQLGCINGIYKKVPGYPDLHFCAGEDDVYGTWVCNDLNVDHTFAPDISAVDIEQYMIDNHIHRVNVTDNIQDLATINPTIENFTEQLVMWSFYISETETSSLIHVVASVDMGGDGRIPKVMKSFDCYITSHNPDQSEYAGALNEIVGSVNAAYVLSDWINALSGTVYNGTFAPANPDPEALRGNISTLLNTMTMVQAGSNSVVNSTLPDDVPLYGCIKMQTSVNNGVLFLASFTAFILVATFTYYITLLALLGKHGIPSCCRRRKDRMTEDELDLATVPSSILTWMLHASREHQIGSGQGESSQLMGVPGTEEDLRDWNFQLVCNGRGEMRLVRTDVSGASGGSSVEQIPLAMQPKLERSGTYEGT